MSDETDGLGGKKKSAQGPKDPVKPIDAEPVAEARQAAQKADPLAEDAAVLSETAPGVDQEEPFGAKAVDAAEPEDDSETRSVEENATRPASRGAASMLWGAAGALLGGALALFGGEAMRPETLPVAEIATKQALETRISAEIKRLATEFSAQISDVEQKSGKLGERQALLEAGLKSGAATAREDQAQQEADLAKLRNALAIERTRISRLHDELAQRERERAAAVTAIREQVSALAAAVAATPSGPIGGSVEGPSGVEASAEISGGGGATAPRAVAAMATRMALLEGGLRRLEARVNGLSAEALPTPDLTRIDQLESAARADRKAREALSLRIDGVERASRSAATGGAALGVAFAALSEGVAGAKPYKDALVLVNELAPPGSVIGEPLIASAETGLPSYVSLTDQLQAGSWKALEAASKARLKSGDGGVLDRLSNIFTFRPHVEPGDASNSDAALLDRARRRIEGRDAAGALAQVNKLSPAAKEALGDWRREAARRAKAESALAALKAQLLGGDAHKPAAPKEAGR